MARSRNIKPGFFTNDDLVEVDFATRLLFAGLWTVADKAGRLEDRPKKIKIAVFPADDVDIDAMLATLAARNFIIRYSVNGAAYIQIRKWSQHQNPHHTEKASVIPECPDGEITVKEPLTAGDSPKQDGGNPADSLIPDSLIPDSLVPPPAAAEPRPSRKKPKTALPEDFTLTATGERLCVEAGFVVSDELAKFKNHHAAAGSLMADWQAGFRTWIDKAKGFRKPWQVPSNVTVPTNPAAIYKPEPQLTETQLAANRANAAAQLEKLKGGGLSAIRQGAH